MERLEEEWQRLNAKDPTSKKHLLWAFIYLYKWHYITRVATNVINTGLNMVVTLLVHRFVTFIEQEDYTEQDVRNAVLIMLLKEFLTTIRYLE